MHRASSNTVAVLLLVLPMLTMAADKSFEELLADLEGLRVEYDVAGFALTVVNADLSRRSGVGGLSDRSSGQPVSADTMFRIGSITKTFNALALMQLAEQGRLDLDTPVRKLAADTPLKNPWADTHPVRISHLLEHSSGLLDLTREEFDRNEPFPTLEAAFAWRPQARVVQWQPGLHSVYSNVNAGLAGLVIERASGQDYAQFITRQLLRPLGMRTAGLVEDENTRRRLATGYDTDGVTPIPYWHMIFPPLGAINVTPREMAAFVELFLRRGRVGSERLFDAALIEHMERPATTLGARHGLTYGYGPGLDQWLHKGFLWYGHGGDGDGYLSRFGYNRDAQAGYFLTINAFKQDALNEMRDRVQEFLTRAHSAPQPVRVNIDPERLRPLTGTFEAVTQRFHWQTPDRTDQDSLRIALEDGVLYTHSGYGRRELIPVDAHRFRREGQPLATIAIAGHDGEIYLQAEFGNYRRIREAP